MKFWTEDSDSTQGCRAGGQAILDGWSWSLCGQHLRCSAIADKTRTIVSVKVNYRRTQS